MREGSDHVQKGTAPFLTQAINRSKVLTDQPICVRMDAGNDSEANFTICETAGVITCLNAIDGGGRWNPF